MSHESTARSTPSIPEDAEIGSTIYLAFLNVDGAQHRRELPPSEQDWRVLPPTLSGDEPAG